MDDVGLLRIISWNVRGVAADIENFLDVLSSETEWDVLILQEFSGSRKILGDLPRTTMQGHQVFQQAPCLGRRIGGIVVHAKNALFVQENSFLSLDRAW